MDRKIIAQARVAIICLAIVAFTSTVRGAQILTWGCPTCGLAPTSFVPVELPPDAKTVTSAIFTQHVAYYTDSQGFLFSHGMNTYGGLGDIEGSWAARERAQRVFLSPNEQVTSVSASSRHTVILARSGRVYGWGSNGFGQLCQNKSSWTDIQWTPSEISLVGASAVQAIATERTSLFLTSDGSIWGCGVNDGPLSTSTEIDSVSLIPTRVASPETISETDSIVVGYSHVLAKSRQGQLWAWGDNRFGQLGVGVGHDRVILRPTLVKFNSTSTRVVSHFASGYSSAAVLSDGSVHAWGSNSFGALGLSSSRPSIYQPVQIQLPSDIAIESVVFSIDGTFCMFLATNSANQKAVFAAGLNRFGGLMSANFSQDYSLDPIFSTDLMMAAAQLSSPISSLHAGTGLGVAITEDGIAYQILSFGAKTSSWSRYMFASPSDTSPRLSILNPQSTPSSIAVKGKSDTLLVIENGMARIWGLWIATTIDGLQVEAITGHPLQLSGPEPFDGGDAANGYVLLRGRSGRLYSAGSDRLCNRCLGIYNKNSFSTSQVNVLGSGTWFDIPVVLFAAGTNMAAAVTADNRIWVWGSPRGLRLSSELPVELSTLAAPAGTIWANLWLSTDTLFIQSSTGKVFVWGSNVGSITCMPSLSNFDSNFIPKLSPWQPIGSLSHKSLRTMAVSATPTGLAEPTLSDNPQPQPANYTQSEFAIFVATDNSVHACGGNYWGQRGALIASLEANQINLPTTSAVSRVAAGTAHALVLLDDNSVVSWGRNDEYQLGLPYSNWTRSSTGVHGIETPKLVFKFGPTTIGAIVAGSKWSVILEGANESQLGRVNFRKETLEEPFTSQIHLPSADEPNHSSTSTSFAIVAAIFSVVIILLIIAFIVSKRRQNFLRVE